MLITLRNVSIAFGGPPLLDKADLTVERGERVALVGRNGSGKSTLLKLLDGELAPESGDITRAESLRVARLAQDLPAFEGGRVFDRVAEGVGTLGRDLAEYRQVSRSMTDAVDAEALARMERLQRLIEAGGGWALDQRVEAVLSRMGLDGDAAFDSLSGGTARRVLLARTLVGEPDLLLLDEPTNHLDIEAITWLEDFLRGWSGTLVFITHDRRFLERLATRIVDLDRGQLTSWPGDFATYLRRKTEVIEAEAAQQAQFDRKLAREEVWIRQGIKARRTRNEGRVRALEQLRETRRQRRETAGSARIQVQAAQRSGRLVIEAENVTCRVEERTLVRDLSTTILRGDKVGVIGPNGVGKTTLLHVLLARRPPDGGTLRHGTRLEIAYFDQRRAHLDEDSTVIDSVGEGSDWIELEEGRRHVVGYLQDFLFTPERARTPVRALSGGERSRLLLARLFARPANLLVMDEPTNDLDMDTLELLETRLVEYSGTLLLVSHDRAFLDNVVTSTLVFEGGARVAEYVGGYADWLRSRPQPAPPADERRKSSQADARPASARAPRPSFKAQRELKTLMGQIEALEQEQAALQARLADPGFQREPAQAIEQARIDLARLEQRLEADYARWEALESG